ncbi:MAG: hypothetical protein WC966_11345 [Bradymonadales bacterium]
MQRLYKRLFVVLLTLFVPAFMACSDDSARVDNGDLVDVDNPKPKKGYEYIIVPFMDREVTINREGSLKLKVALYSIKDGEPVSGEEVGWAVRAGEGVLKLQSLATVTDDEGYTSVLLNSTGEMGDVEIVASNLKAPKNVLFTVHVVDLPSGDLFVQASYSGAAPIVNYSIRLYDYYELDCSRFDARYPVADEPLMKVDAMSAKFEKLLVDEKFSVLAYGYAANGAAVAAGCVDSNVQTRENEVTNITVPLETIHLDPVTRYHVRSYFNFGNIVENMGETGRWIAKILEGVDNPGKLMYEVLVDDLLLGAGCGNILPDFLCIATGWLMGTFGLKDKLTDYLNNLVVESDTGCKMINFGCQLRNIMQTLELMGTLNIQRSGTGFTLSGKNSYTGLAVYWRVKCADDPDPNCGRTPISADLGNDINLIEGTWGGGLSNGYDKLSIDRHNINMHYGKVIVYVVEHFLLPKVAGGATNFTDALAHWFNCDSIATWFNNNIKLPSWLGGYGVSYEQGMKWCRSGVNLIDSALGFGKTFANLKYQSSFMTLSGTGIFKDKNADNVVDHISDGVWHGELVTDGDVSTVSGMWSGYNLNNSGYCSYPKTSTDSDDQICSYPPIDISSIIESKFCGTCKGFSF